jgi:hypothetical protein
MEQSFMAGFCGVEQEWGHGEDLGKNKIGFHGP